MMTRSSVCTDSSAAEYIDAHEPSPVKLIALEFVQAVETFVSRQGLGDDPASTLIPFFFSLLKNSSLLSHARPPGHHPDEWNTADELSLGPYGWKVAGRDMG